MVGNMKKSKYEVVGMCCNSEVALIERILKRLDGVKEISIMFPTRTLTVVHDIHLISESQIGNIFILFYSTSLCLCYRQIFT